MLANKIICGDCLEKIKEYIPDEVVDLIYIDPPFFSGRDYEVVWKDGFEIRSFEDSAWYQRICSNCKFELEAEALYCSNCGKSTENAEKIRSKDIKAYLNWLTPRLKECYRVLKHTGSIYVHLDWHAVHYVKVILDQIFGYENFQNEIIWHYRRWTTKSKRFQRMHDSILFYTKTDQYYFKKLFQPYASTTSMHSRKLSIDGKTVLKPNPKGVAMNDVWILPYLNSHTKERLGYPTQKPEKLLERIIQTSSRPGDLVLDAFSGCSTALVVANRLGRKWIGIDVSPTACRVSFERLIQSGARIKFSDILDLPLSREELKNLPEQELKNWILKSISARGIESKLDLIDGLTFDGCPIGVIKDLSPQILRKFAGSCQRLGQKQGIIFTFTCPEKLTRDIQQIFLENNFKIKIEEIQKCSF